MAEYIEREAAFNAILKLVPKVDCNGSCWVIRGVAAAAIDNIPAADVRPVVKAKIVDMRYTEDDGEWKCSRCGWQFTLCMCGKDVTRKIHFCPNCGADMREEN